MTLKQLVAEVNSTTQTWQGKTVDLLNERTCYFYRNQGILAAPLQAGPMAQYGEHHLKQLLAVKALQRTGKSLADIKAQMAGTTSDQLTDLLLNSGVRIPHLANSANGGAPETPAQPAYAETSSLRTIEPWGAMQIQEPTDFFGREPQWTHQPLNQFYTLVGAPGAPAIPPEVFKHIQQLLQNLPRPRNIS